MTKIGYGKGEIETFAYDAQGRLAKHTRGKKAETYSYDHFGRLVKEGARTYRYGYLDKVLAITEGKVRHTYGDHVDGQLASATKRTAVKPKKGGKPPAPETEEFLWDGLALVKRGGASYVNEPHPGGGAAVLSSKDGVMFNDILGTTLGVEGEGGYTATPLTAFGDGPAQRLNTATPLHRQAAGRRPRPCVPDAQLPRGPRQVAHRRSPRLPRRLEPAGVLREWRNGCCRLAGRASYRYNAD